MTSIDSLLYLSKAIQKIEAGGAASEFGSHVMGIYGRSANAFEKEIRSYTAKMLKRCGLDYDVDLRASVRGPVFPKLTLGNCIAVIEEAARLRRECVTTAVPGGWKLSGFVDALKKVNETWVQAKHGEDVSPAVQLIRLKSMVSVLTAMSVGQ